MTKHRPSGQLPSATSGIKALFCDLGNVLVTFRNRTDWLCEIAKMLRRDWGSPDRAAASKLILLQRLAAAGVIDAIGEGERRCWKLDTGHVTVEQLYHAFLAAVEVTRDRMPLFDFACAYNAHHGVIKSTCELVRQVQARGLALIAATNGDSQSACNLVELTTDIHWDGRAMSWQIGHKKPDERFFRRCLTLAEEAIRQRLEWAHCVLVDDIKAYVDAYDELGSVGICFDATTQPASVLRRAFRKLGLLPPTAAPLPTSEEASC